MGGVKQKNFVLQRLCLFNDLCPPCLGEIWSLIIELELRRYCAAILICAVHFLSSRLPHADGMFGRHDSQVWDLGHGGAGAVSQPCTHVLQGSPGCHRGVWHHQHSEWRVDSNEAEVTVCRQLKLMIPYLWHGDRTWLSNLSQSYATCKSLHTFFFLLRIHSHVQRTGWRSCSDKPAQTLLSHWQETKQIWPTNVLWTSR